MILTPVYCRALFTLVIAGVLSAPLAAQNVLFTDLNGKYLAVRKARGNQPYVDVAGKLTAADGHNYALKKVEEYLPAFVAVRDLQVKSRHLNLNGSELNQEFDFSAGFESPYDLDDVFIVLELDSEKAGKILFLQEVGNLEARQSKSIDVRVPLSFGVGEGKYQFHLFSGGMEVLHSRIPPQVRDHVVDRMTAKRIGGVQDAPPKLFVGPGPEYPHALLKAKTSGQAVVSLRIGANGQVYDPKLKSATDPAFGESALTAVRLWRFLPQVRNGRAVEASVEVPINFAPPEKKS